MSKFFDIVSNHNAAVSNENTSDLVRDQFNHITYSLVRDLVDLVNFPDDSSLTEAEQWIRSVKKKLARIALERHTGKKITQEEDEVLLNKDKAGVVALLKDRLI